jgi:hypothetical protein
MAGHHLRLLRQYPDFECDFETARRIVYADARTTWDGFGTLYVAPYASEDATRWQVIESVAWLDGMSRVGPWPDEMEFA